MRMLLAALLVALASAVTVPAATGSDEAPCAASSLAATFSLVPGSAGAGNVVYALRLRNRSQVTCFVSGLPSVQLLDRRGRRLPTRVTAAFPNALTAVLVRLRPGGFASASARFSPDVPGPGEGHPGKPCEPKAYRMRVQTRPGSGWTSGPVQPPTSVCEHGRLSVSALVAGKTPPHA